METRRGTCSSDCLQGTRGKWMKMKGPLGVTECCLSELSFEAKVLYAVKYCVRYPSAVTRHDC